MHLLFDLDGTLTDPKPGILGCIRYALSRFDVEIPDDTRLESCIGPPLRDSFKLLLGNRPDDHDRVEAAVGFYRERFTTTGLFENQVYDGIPGCLAALQERTGSIHLATSKPRIYADRIIDHFELRQYFTSVYGSELDGRLGDKTELIGHLLKAEGLDSAATTMIGDRSFDAIGARNNNVGMIGVSWGYGSESELEQAGASRICHHPDSLPDLLLR